MVISSPCCGQNTENWTAPVRLFGKGKDQKVLETTVCDPPPTQELRGGSANSFQVWLIFSLLHTKAICSYTLNIPSQIILY